MMDAEALIREWLREYPCPGDFVWGGFIELGGSAKDGYRMGQCTQVKYVSQATHEWTPRSTMYLDEGMAKAPTYFQESVLWHEFCHARAFNEDMESNDHDAHFREYRRQKTGYWLCDMLLKAIGFIWCH